MSRVITFDDVLRLADATSCVSLVRKAFELGQNSKFAGYEFYANMQKRSNGGVHSDLHKTDHRIYFTAEEAQAAIDADPEIAPYRHVVRLVACTPEELLP